MSKYPGRIVTDLAPAGYSVYFDGTGDYLTWSGSTVGTGAFTFECWFYYTGTFSAIAAFVGPGTAVTDALNLYINNSTQLTFDQYGVTATSFTVPTMVANQWYHVAFVRNAGGSATVFLNGVRSSTGAVSITTNYASIGAIGYVSSAVPRPWIGYLSNVRYTTAAVYDPTATTINVPTQLLNVTNTQLLTCNSPAIIDQSSNAFTITVNGNAVASTFTPFAAYNPYNPELGAATPGVWTVDEAMQAAATRQWNMYDPYFNLTTLLLHGNGANNAQNNTFLDSSSNNFAITRNGNTTQGSFSPFSQTGWSVFFNGADFTDIYAASSADFNFGSGDFTIECFFNSSNAMSTASFWRLFDTGQITCFFYNGSIYLRNAASSELVTVVAHGLSVGVWYHLAFVRSSTTYSIYRNGSLLTSGTGGTITSASAPFFIGTNTGWNQPLSGYVSNFRVTTGQALYTTTFTPTTTPLTTTSQGATASNVKLLTCQSNRFVDNSTQNTKTILFGDNGTNLGTRFVQAFSPFYPTAAYDAATVGGSGYFDGSGDYLSLANNSAFSLASSALTVECWVYLTQIGLTHCLIATYQNSSSGWGIQVNSDNTVIWFNSGDGAEIQSSMTLSANSWYHIAVSGTAGSSLKLFINGSQQGGTSTSNIVDGSAGLLIGAIQPSSPTNYTKGYISNARLIKGTALYTTTFTPPTAPLTAITNTQLLTNFTNAGIIDSTADNVLETVGDAKISTAVSKFGGSSMYFDGTGDSLLLPSSPIRALGTADFTIEFWFNASSIPTFAAIMDMRDPNTDNAGFDIMFYFNKLAFGTATFTYITGVTTLSTGTWYHYALTRSGNVFKQFLNGVQEGSTYTGSSTQNFTNSILRIANGANGPYTGYLDDIRITRGYARYIGNFTPQTSQWQDE